LVLLFRQTNLQDQSDGGNDQSNGNNDGGSARSTCVAEDAGRDGLAVLIGVSVLGERTVLALAAVSAGGLAVSVVDGVAELTAGSGLGGNANGVVVLSNGRAARTSLVLHGAGSGIRASSLGGGESSSAGTEIDASVSRAVRSSIAIGDESAIASVGNRSPSNALATDARLGTIAGVSAGVPNFGKGNASSIRAAISRNAVGDISAGSSSSSSEGGGGACGGGGGANSSRYANLVIMGVYIAVSTEGNESSACSGF